MVLIFVIMTYTLLWYASDQLDQNDDNQVEEVKEETVSSQVHKQQENFLQIDEMDGDASIEVRSEYEPVTDSTESI